MCRAGGVSVNEGMRGVYFGWGTAGGSAAEGEEAVRESATVNATGPNQDRTTVSLRVKGTLLRQLSMCVLIHLYFLYKFL